MRGLAVGIAAAAAGGVILAGFVVAAVDFWGATTPPKPPKPPAAEVVRLGPDGTHRSYFGDDLTDAAIPHSHRFALCVGEMRVQRPSMLATDMPDAFCRVTRAGRAGPWRISTGGWQQCQAVCVAIRR